MPGHLSNDPLNEIRPLWRAREAAQRRVATAKVSLAMAKLALVQANRRLNEAEGRMLREPRQ